jgi:DNA-binding MarR family transcriptional regulator
MAVRRRNAVLEVVELCRRTVPQLTVTDLVVIFYVAENPGINMAELAVIARTTLATASRVTRALASPETEGALPPYAGLLDLRPNPHYAKGRLLYLSQKGAELCARADQFIQDGVLINPAGQAAA